jgi:GT2 family glycosyltransferase
VHGDLATEVIVVDNASTDGSVEAARRYSGVRVIECRSNLGYGRANNIGFRAARGGHLLVLNPDALLQTGSLTTLVNFLKARPGAGIIAPRLLNPDGSSQEAAFRFPTLLMAMLDLFPPPSVLPGRARHWLLHSKLNGRYPHEARACRPFPIDHPLGACMLINRAAYEQLGGFDEKMFMYSEEIDLAMRYRKAGWECWQVPVSPGDTLRRAKHTPATRPNVRRALAFQALSVTQALRYGSTGCPLQPANIGSVVPARDGCGRPQAGTNRPRGGVPQAEQS